MEEFVEKLIRDITASGMKQLQIVQNSNLQLDMMNTIEQSIFDTMLEQFDIWLKNLELNDEQVAKILEAIKRTNEMKKIRLSNYYEKKKKETVPGQMGE